MKASARVCTSLLAVVLGVPIWTLACSSSGPSGYAPGPDAATAETQKPDAASDVARDTNAPKPDAPPILDAGPDWLIPTISTEAFLEVISQNWCQLVIPYCASPESGEGYGTVTQAGCDAVNGVVPQFPNYLVSIQSGAHVTLDVAAADACLAAQTAWFTSGDAAAYKAVYNDCVAAFVGLIPMGGSGCTSSIDCAEGYCDTTSSKCSPILTSGQACTSNDQCARLSQLGSDNWCGPTDAGASQCTLTLPYGAACAKDEDCWTGLCLGTCAYNLPGYSNASDELNCSAYVAASAFLDAGSIDGATDALATDGGH